MSLPPINLPITISSLAKKTGWDARRLRRLLLTLDREAHGMLLVPSRGAKRRYLVRLATLQKIAPDFFDPVRSLEADMESLGERVAALEAGLEKVAQSTGRAHRDIAAIRSKAA